MISQIIFPLSEISINFDTFHFESKIYRRLPLATTSHHTADYRHGQQSIHVLTHVQGAVAGAVVAGSKEGPQKYLEIKKIIVF